MLTVTIVNCYHDSNKGSCALAWGLIRQLQRTQLVQTITLMTLYHQDSPLFPSAFRHVQTRFPHIAMLPSPLRSPSRPAAGSESGYRRGVGDWLRLVPPFAGLASTGGRRRLAAREAGLAAIRDSDLVIWRGGPLPAAPRATFNPGLYATAFPLLYARREGVAYGFAPQSVGPLRSAESRRLVATLVKDSRFVFVRDRPSALLLAQCGADRDRLVTMLDSAFWVEPRSSPRLEGLLARAGVDTGFLAVTVRGMFPMAEWTPYHQELARAIDRVVPSVYPRAIIVANTYSDQGLDDRPAMRDLYRHIRHRDAVTLMMEDLAPDELAALYGRARLLVGTRLHSVALALAAGTPSVAVAYAPKTWGLMELLGLEAYTIDQRAFHADRAIPILLAAEAGQHDVAATVSRLKAAGEDGLRRSLADLPARRNGASAVGEWGIIGA